MSKADAVEPPPSSDQCDVPRLGLLQCPNAELLGWTAPSSEPNSTLTSDVDDNVMVMASPKRLHDRLGDDESNTCAPSKSKPIDVQKYEEGSNEESSFKRRRTSPTKSVYLSNPGDGCAGDHENAINEAHDLGKIQESTNNDTGSKNVVDDAKSAIKAVLDYETDSSDSMQDGKRCQILSVTLPSFGDNNDSSSSSLLSNASIVIGTISGRTKLELLPIISETDESHALSSSIFLDIFGYRLQSKSITSSKSNSIIINRPGWMNSLPLTVITNNFTVSGTSITLRVKLHSIYDENDTSTIQATTNESANNESYYSAYAEESYNIKTLAPGYIFPGNYTLGGSGVTTILKPWEATMDAVIKTLQRHDESNFNCNRTLICGAKGCGKSTMLRYVTNRILSEQIMKDSGSTDVAVLDLDCGQPELSVPGLITFADTIFP